jgi:hypothetical protein
MKRRMCRTGLLAGLLAGLSLNTGCTTAEVAQVLGTLLSGSGSRTSSSNSNSSPGPGTRASPGHDRSAGSVLAGTSSPGSGSVLPGPFAGDAGPSGFDPAAGSGPAVQAGARPGSSRPSGPAPIPSFGDPFGPFAPDTTTVRPADPAPETPAAVPEASPAPAGGEDLLGPQIAQPQTDSVVDNTNPFGGSPTGGDFDFGGAGSPTETMTA